MTATVTEISTAPTRRRLRLAPAPRIDGPFDDEPASDEPPFVAGSLALAFPPPTRVTVPLRLVPPADGHESAAHGDPPRDPRLFAARLAQALAEVLAGARPPQQLTDVASLDVLHQLERNAGRLVTRRGMPASAPRVASVHVSEPGDGIAEACAVVDTGPRRRALAFRVETVRGRWRCTAVHVG